MNRNGANSSRKASVDSPIGVLELREEHGKIVEIRFSSGKRKAPLRAPSTEILEQCALELEEYFQGNRRDFSVPLHLQGTPFRQKVWKALQKIPYGETCSYKDVALTIGNGKACRAVGGANHHNPVVIMVPCHRVIGAKGSLTGFGGGLEVKRWLLDHEKAHLSPSENKDLGSVFSQ